MAFNAILLLLAVVGPVFSKTVGSWERHHAVPEFGSMVFDIEEEKDDSAIQNEVQVCQTDHCKIIAKEFIQGMNKSVDPCDNFYDFVCGAYQNQDRIPPYKASWGRFDLFQETVYRRIAGILETEPEPKDILPVRQAKKWYRSCMDKDALKSRGLKPLESILMQVGGWPMAMDKEEWNEEDHSWQSVEHDYFHITGSYVFYDFFPVRFFKVEGILIKIGDLPLEQEIPSKYRDYENDDYDAYVQLIVAVTQMFVDYNKADVTEGMIKKDARDLVEFEKQLYLLSQDSDFEEESDLSVAEFIELYNENVTALENEDDEIQKIDFRGLIRRLFDAYNYNVNESVDVVAQEVSSYVNVTKLLNETPKRTIVNYINWHFVSSMITYTTDDMRNLFYLLMKTNFDIKKKPPRWLECTEEMKMDRAAAYAFVQKYFTNETDKGVREMIENIRVEMESEIDRSSWMDDETKRLSKDKLNSMRTFVGFPSWYKNRTIVINSYKGLTIGYDLFDNVLSYRKYEKKQNLLTLVTTDDEDDGDLSKIMDPLEVNAGYGPLVNAIELPAADFQPPLFTSQLPSNINYGVAGVVIGHEIGHGFDDTGIEISKNGNETKISKQMLELYYKRAECFLDQFNEYFGVTEPNYDGTTPEDSEPSLGLRTRGENIADTTGIHSVFEAYRKMIAKKPNREPKLPGFEEYTDNQMFFISFAAVWCEAITPKMLAKQLANDEHSPSRLRVIGAVSNTNDFAKAFNCPKGSAMNPENKCNIWKSTKPKIAAPKKLASRRRSRHHDYHELIRD